MTRPDKKLNTLSVAALAFALFGGAGTVGTAALGIAPAAVAQDAQAPQPAGGSQRGQRMGQILLSLNLSESQKNRIRDLRSAMIKENAGVTDREQKRANFKKFQAQLDTILTPAQDKEFHAKWDAMRKQYQSQQGSH
jgi:Spy/CpxP family protein refolding chaperone